MASTTYRSSTSANTAATPAASLALNLPAGCVANDILVACIGVAGGTGATITPPTGWTLVSSQAQSTNMLMSVYWYLATGYDAASFTWSFDSARQASGIVLDYSGAYNYPPCSSSSTSTATLGSTTVTTAPTSSYETGRGIQFFGAYNTTGATTMTSGGGGYTQRVDTCTTASAFIEVAGQDLAKGLAIGSITTKAANIAGQTATSIAISVFIDDQRPAFYSLGEDEFQAGSFTSSVSSTNTKTIATNVPNELILAFVTIQKGTTTVSGISGGGLTWVNVGRANTNAGSVELWRTLAPTPTSFTATITYSALTASGNHMFVSIIGADLTGTNGSGAIGAFATGTSTTAAPTINVTTTRNGSWVWMAANDPTDSATAAVAGTNQLLLRDISDGTNTCQGWVQRQTSVTPQTGTVVTMNSTAPTTDSCNILAVEILPALHYNLSATGAG